MNHEERFHQAMLQLGWGGRYAHEDDPIDTKRAYMKALVDSLHDRALRFSLKPGLPRPFPEVYAGVANRKTMNACAFRYGDTYYVAVCLGVFDLLTETFLRLLHRADVFPWLGVPIGMNSLDQLPPLRRDLAIPTPGDAPFIFDPVRLSAASWLGMRAIDFIVLHEVRHLTGGHVDYVASALNANMIVEAASVGAHSDKSLIRQALELEADFAGIIGLLENRFGPEPTLDLNLSFLGAIENKSQRVLCLLLTAVTAVLKLFGTPLPDYVDWEKLDHPPDEVRRYLILDCAASHLKMWGHVDLADLRETADEIYNVIDVALHQLLSDPPVAYDRQTLYGSGGYGEAHFRKIVKLRRDIQTDVVPFAFLDTVFAIDD